MLSYLKPCALKLEGKNHSILGVSALSLYGFPASILKGFGPPLGSFGVPHGHPNTAKTCKRFSKTQFLFVPNLSLSDEKQNFSTSANWYQTCSPSQF